MPPGRYLVRASFSGSLDGKIVGFYRSRYTDRTTGQRRYIATSKFEPTYARQAFPCFDEPSFKANFSVRLVRPSDGYSALSNMNVLREVPDSPTTGLTTVYFAESVPMSTYLACFIVSDFQRLNPVFVKNPDGTEFPISVYSTPAQVNKTIFALKDGVSITQYYINYFGIGYPLPKLDMIAIPDFVSGAMEHWGLVTYRETTLLFDSSISSVINQQRVSIVVAHELAHMWFGNLVTMEWWDDLWLNEGFASFMEYKGSDSVHPDWNLSDQFLIDDLHPVLELDSSLSSHPIVQPVENPDQISEIFDTISYNKGASVIRMLEDFMGTEPFRVGISNYLKKYKFGNAVTAKLWEALQDEVVEEGVNVTGVMDTWTRQMGYPVVEVRRGADKNVRILSQKRFLSNPHASFNASDSPYQYKWEIPVTYVTSEETTRVQRMWLRSSEDEKQIQVGNAQWLKLNSRQVGYYRVNYDEADWNTLIELLDSNNKTLGTADRAHLLDDAFSLARAGLLPYGTALQLSRCLSHEEDYVPWATANTHFTKLFRLLRSSHDTHKMLKAYLQEKIKGVYNKLGWNINDTDSHLQRRLRVTVLELSCLYELPECLQQVGNEFDGWLVQPNYKPHPDLRALIYYYGMASNGSEESWDQLWQIYLSENDAQEKVKLMYGLAGTPNKDSLKRYLKNAKDENFIRSQDFFIVLTYISANPVGTSIVWDFFRNEWEYLVQRFTLHDRYLGTAVYTITKHFSTQQRLDEMKAFFAQYPDAGAGTIARKQALETVENNIQWVASYEPNIRAWLSTVTGV